MQSKNLSRKRKHADFEAQHAAAKRTRQGSSRATKEPVTAGMGPGGYQTDALLLKNRKRRKVQIKDDPLLNRPSVRESSRDAKVAAKIRISGLDDGITAKKQPKETVKRASSRRAPSTSRGYQTEVPEAAHGQTANKSSRSAAKRTKKRQNSQTSEEEEDDQLSDEDEKSLYNKPYVRKAGDPRGLNRSKQSSQPLNQSQKYAKQRASSQAAPRQQKELSETYLEFIGDLQDQDLPNMVAMIQAYANSRLQYNNSPEWSAVSLGQVIQQTSTKPGEITIFFDSFQFVADPDRESTGDSMLFEAGKLVDYKYQLKSLNASSSFKVIPKARLQFVAEIKAILSQRKKNIYVTLQVIVYPVLPQVQFKEDERAIQAVEAILRKDPGAQVGLKNLYCCLIVPNYDNDIQFLTVDSLIVEGNRLLPVKLFENKKELLQYNQIQAGSAKETSNFMLSWGFDYNRPEILYSVLEDHTGHIQVIPIEPKSQTHSQLDTSQHQQYTSQHSEAQKKSVKSSRKSAKSRVSQKPYTKDFQTDYEGVAPSRKSTTVPKARKEPRASTAARQSGRLAAVGKTPVTTKTPATKQQTEYKHLSPSKKFREESKCSLNHVKTPALSEEEEAEAEAEEEEEVAELQRREEQSSSDQVALQSLNGRVRAQRATKKHANQLLKQFQRGFETDFDGEDFKKKSRRQASESSDASEGLKRPKRRNQIKEQDSEEMQERKAPKVNSIFKQQTENVPRKKRAVASDSESKHSEAQKSGSDSETVSVKRGGRSRSRGAKSSPARQAMRSESRRTRGGNNNTIAEVEEKESSQDVEMKSEEGELQAEEKEESDDQEDDDVENNNDEQINNVLQSQSNPLKKGSNYYDQACQKLQLNAIPDSLPCRDKERHQIREYITQGLKNGGSSSSLYISGMPGTGKTATTLQEIKTLLGDKKKSNKFSFLHINAMSLTNPNLVYTIIYESITGRRVNPASAALFLDEFFKKSNKQKILQAVQSKEQRSSKTGQADIKKAAEKMRVVLIDELDALITKKQTLLYNLFDWPCHQNSKLLVISIANTMDLPERMQVKISSRIGNNRLVYEPYNLNQILTILSSRLKTIDAIFQAQSLDFVAKKVSMYSGDIRRSLQITKRAVEICRDEHIVKVNNEEADMTPASLTKVTYRHVISAFDELFNSKTVQVLSTLKKNEVIVIIALYNELNARKIERVLLDDVHDRCNHFLRQVLGWQAKLQTQVFREIVKRLQAFGLVALTIEHSKICNNVNLQLLCFKDELKSAYANTDYVQQVAKVMAPLQELFKENERTL